MNLNKQVHKQLFTEIKTSETAVWNMFSCIHNFEKYVRNLKCFLWFDITIKMIGLQQCIWNRQIDGKINRKKN